MGRVLTLLVTGVVWAVMMAGLLTREIIPYLEYQETPTYRAVLYGGPRHQQIRRGIYEGPKRVGEAITLVYPGPRASTNVRTRFRMKLTQLPIQVGSLEVRMGSRVVVNAAYDLDSFVMEGDVLLPVRMEGRRTGDELHVSGSMGKMKREAVIPYEKGMILGGTSLPQIGIGHRKVGDKWKIHTIDFDLLTRRPKVSTVYASIEQEMEKEIRGKRIRVKRVEIRQDATKELRDSQFYVDEEGVVVLEEIVLFNVPYRIELEERSELTPEELSSLLMEFQ